MALRDPGMKEFIHMVDTEELATAFAREHGLLVSNEQLEQVNNNEHHQTCALGEPGT
jgi:hypothetical protein